VTRIALDALAPLASQITIGSFFQGINAEKAVVRSWAAKKS
jgi:hypothetical protein